jgi:protease YdgD
MPEQITYFGTGGASLTIKDNRVRRVRDSEVKTYPFAAIGIVSDQVSGSSCTGFVIEKRIVLTSAHCFSYLAFENDHSTVPTQRREANPESIKFFANAREASVDGNHYTDKYDILEVKKGAWFKTHQVQDDWAILVLKNNIADEIVPLSLASLPASDLIKKHLGNAFMIGYPGGSFDLRAAIIERCSVTSVNDVGTISHDCPGPKGMSGSPVMVKIENKFYAVGIHSGYIKSTRNGIEHYSMKALGLSSIYSEIQKIILKTSPRD